MNQSHKTSSLYVFLLFILLSCNNITESKNTLLNSERIEQKFGSYGIDIVQSDNQSRVSFLYSLDPNNKNKKKLSHSCHSKIQRNKKGLYHS